jgi:hypothetical protein
LKEEGADPVALFDLPQATTKMVRYERQDARHGALNFSNVVVEETSENLF